ncbi:N-acetylmuramoyl-L-alanine amidase [Mucinivorans hirudinis]|uniref:N-acetylmuramoyl-L-alanine amidase n=1 Tax=Mucinivorans hirudinis TaxID=1433126 RepID=A0A060R7D1_9BACT|nr:N-acetylmuramoyl-L-alanine amidase [Mucinivorans hirudinis]
MKLYCKLIYLLFTICLSIASSGQSAVKCIVIDAGHGGKDPGATNGKMTEKSITLAVSLKLGEIIKAKHPQIKVLYTRRDDVFVPLHERSNFANKSGADLLISIHTNAARNTQATGMETFIMGVDKSEASLAVAMRENDVIAFESDYSVRYDGFEPGSAESFIIFSLMNYAYRTKSLELATLVQKQYADNFSTPNRGVKQAGLLVLWQSAMPSILTEIGFLSNPTEGKYIASTEGQQKIAQAIFNAVDLYIGSTQTRELKVERNETAKENYELYYRVLAIISKKKKEINSMNFGQYVSVTQEVFDGEIYKYFVEKLFSYKDALTLQQRMTSLFPQGRVVAFKGSREISLDQAKEIEREKL